MDFFITALATMIMVTIIIIEIVVARVIDEYRYRGHNYRVCRRGNDVFYC